MQLTPVRLHCKQAIFLALLSVTLFACGIIPGRDEPRPSIPATGAPGIDPPPVGEVAIVEKIVDGDTFDVALAAGTFRVRLIGVDAPETQGPVGCFGNEAAAFTKQTIIPGTTVTLERDVSDKDRFGRLLRYAYTTGGVMLNELLLREGFAYVVSYEPDVKYQERFRLAEREARTASKGLWAKCSASPQASPPPVGSTDTLYDPFGSDKDCADFPSWELAQKFFLAAGGPDNDPHHLDDDGDGISCELIPGAPG